MYIYTRNICVISIISLVNSESEPSLYRQSNNSHQSSIIESHDAPVVLTAVNNIKHLLLCKRLRNNANNAIALISDPLLQVCIILILINKNPFVLYIYFSLRSVSMYYCISLY